MEQKPQGVISYAGMDVQTLLAGARLMFAGDGSEGESRLASVMPLFPAELILSMPFVGVAQPGMNVAPGGFSIDPAEYHCRLQARRPGLYAGDNLLRNTDAEGQFHGRGVVTVDEVWTTCFPQYQPYAGERLTIYPLGGGAQCAAVPESLYPRAAGFLRQAETALGVTRRCHDYAHYVYARIRSGQSFDADLFETEYLADRGLAPVTITQVDLGRLMQDLSMLRSVREGSEGGGLYTENAKRAEHIRQYVPGLYACDVFEEVPQSRYTARLVQPLWEDGFVSDWWMPWQDAQAFFDRERGALDMSALCQGYQIAPVYDPATRGGRYPAGLRMVSVRDRELKLRLGDTLNNPAYGSGMSPAGGINKLVYLPGSRELLRQGRLESEEAAVECEKTGVPPEDYREMTALASLQEGKGRLVDALYRRESVLSEVHEVSPEYAQLRQMMNEPVERLERTMARREKAGLSGYDADLDYLRRMGMEREWKPMPNKQKTFRFAPDALRQASIESGFAMRTACLRCQWEELRLPDDGTLYGTAADAGEGAFPIDGELLSGGEARAACPLWENAADPCYLTTEAGGLYPTDEAAAAGAPLPGEKDAAADEAKGKPAKSKGKKSGKGRKKAVAQTAEVAAQPAKPGNERRFSEEELMKRQMHMALPESAGDQGSAGERMPAADLDFDDQAGAAVAAEHTGDVEAAGSAASAETAADGGDAAAEVAAAEGGEAVAAGVENAHTLSAGTDGAASAEMTADDGDAAAEVAAAEGGEAVAAGVENAHALSAGTDGAASAETAADGGDAAAEVAAAEGGEATATTGGAIPANTTPIVHSAPAGAIPPASGPEAPQTGKAAGDAPSASGKGKPKGKKGGKKKQPDWPEGQLSFLTDNLF